MKIVIQRVKSAKVEVEGKVTGEINRGMVVLVGFEKRDKEQIDEKIKFAGEKITNLRIFDDSHGKMNLSVKDVKGSILVVSNFTLAGSLKRGRRPSFDDALEPQIAAEYYRKFVDFLKTLNIPVKEGKFQSYMKVFIENDGPVTFILEK